MPRCSISALLGEWCVPKCASPESPVSPRGTGWGGRFPVRVGLPNTPLDMFGLEVCVSSGLVNLQPEYRHLHLQLFKNPVVYQEGSGTNWQWPSWGGCHLTLIYLRVVYGDLHEVRPWRLRLPRRGVSIPLFQERLCIMCIPGLILRCLQEGSDILRGHIQLVMDVCK